MGPYQVNMNRPGTTWFIPLTDAGYLNSALINFMDCWHMYFIDEWNGGRAAGPQKGSGGGKAGGASLVGAGGRAPLSGGGSPSREGKPEHPPPPRRSRARSRW